MRRLFALIVLAALLGGAFYVFQARGGRLPGGREPVAAIEDARTTLSVKTALSLRRSLRPLKIDVSTENGVVTLRGEIPQELKDQAQEVVAEVPGVRQVVNHLQTRPGSLPAESSERTMGEALDDETLAVQVRLALSLDRRLEGSNISARAYQREVTLSGEALDVEQKRRAVEIARQTPHVASVVDEIRARHEPSPAGRREAVEQALSSNANLAGYRLSVRDGGGKLTMTGKVRTGAERDLAGFLAREAAGGPVENGIKVEAESRQ